MSKAKPINESVDKRAFKKNLKSEIQNTINSILVTLINFKDFF